MSSDMKRTIHTIIFKEGDLFIASGVELDIFAQGNSAEEALARLEITLRAEAQEAEDSGRDLFDIGPAPDSIHALYKSRNAQVVARDELAA